MGSAILAVLSSLPDIINLVKEASTWLNHVSGNDPQGFIKKIGAAMAQVNSAQSIKEREDAAQALANAIHNLP